SADKNFYAIKESTGTMLWMYAATAPITAGAAVYSATSLSFGDQSGTMYLVTTSGKALYVMARGLNGKPVIGVSNVQGNTFVETASGLVAMIRIVNTGFVAWSQQTGSTLSTSPTIVDGTVYIGSADGGLYAFTPQGANPLAKPRGITVTITNAWRCTTTP
ncbi:MAG: PQQ-binding-like beta-propeller repeat protein, partial [Candidatus Baltobacteraceae bacterium]